MVKPEVRRQNDILITQKLWAAISVIRTQRQIPNLERISRYLEREYGMKEEDIVNYLQMAGDEQLVLHYTTVGNKGARVGVEQDGYRIPTTEGVDKGDHDWYCFDCHQPGEVVACNSCWRVYHTACTEEDWQGPTFVCAVCKACKEKEKLNIRRKDLSKLLEFTVRRLKEKTRELHSLMPRNELEQLSYDWLIFHHVDLNTLEERCVQRRYASLEQFYADCRTILHNTFISYGDVGKMADLARIMIRDCTYDLEEIRQCRDCYYYSNARPVDWFCEPCKPAHTLVYAKQQGFSYWPAKLIKITQLGYDVRFFGGFHQRAIIPETSIRSIDTPHKAMNIKKTPGFTKAMDELGRHQALLERARLASDNQSTEDENDADDGEIDQKPFIALSPAFHAAPPMRNASLPPTEMTAATAPKRKRKSSVRDNDDDLTPRPRKRQQRDSERVSSTDLRAEKLVTTPDDNDMVTSSEDNAVHGGRHTVPTSDSSTQTSKKLLHGKQPNKSVQTDESGDVTGARAGASGQCNCEAKYQKFFGEFKDRLDLDHKDELESALRLQEDKLRKEFEEERRQVSARQAASVQREVDKARALAEERTRDSHTDEIKAIRDAHAEDMKTAEKKHKAELSAAKKKQWCYNCEEEAMYHCCWNTSYCSLKCQQDHWHREHKRLCRRKRP